MGRNVEDSLPSPSLHFPDASDNCGAGQMVKHLSCSTYVPISDVGIQVKDLCTCIRYWDASIIAVFT